MRDDAVLRRALPLGRGLGRLADRQRNQPKKQTMATITYRLGEAPIAVLRRTTNLLDVRYKPLETMQTKMY